jgi:hypothetical protein
VVDALSVVVVVSVVDALSVVVAVNAAVLAPFLVTCMVQEQIKRNKRVCV